MDFEDYDGIKPIILLDYYPYTLKENLKRQIDAAESLGVQVADLADETEPVASEDLEILVDILNGLEDRLFDAGYDVFSDGNSWFVYQSLLREGV